MHKDKDVRKNGDGQPNRHVLKGQSETLSLTNRDRQVLKFAV